MTRTTYVKYTPEGRIVRTTRFRVHWSRIIGATVVGLILAGGVVWGIDHLPVTYPPCVTEDQTSPACYWDADTRSNGQGHSFLVHEDGTVEYTD